MKSEANVEDLRNKVVSDGTMRPEDLIPKFLGVLKEYAPDRYDAYVKENPEVLDLKGMDDETLGFVVEELFDELDKIAPEGCIFGATDGDGACYGFWDTEASESRECEAQVSEKTFKQGVDEFIGAAPEGGWSDYWAMQQDWEFYKDSLCRDGVITQKQADSWSNPCTPETFARWQKRNGLVRRGYESKKSEGADDKVVPDENDFEKCPYCGSHNTDIHYEVDLAIPADVLAYATCKDCGKEYHGQFVFMGAYYGKDEHDYDPIDTCPFCGSKEHTETVQFDGGGYVDQDFKCKSCGGTWYNSFVWSDTQSAFESHTHKSESKKSEGLPFGKRFTDAAGHTIELSDWRIKEDDLGYFCGYDKGGKPIFDQDISKAVVFPFDQENYPNDEVSKEMDRLWKMGYTNTRKLQKATRVESKKSEADERMAINDYANKRFYDPDEFVKYVRKVAKDGSYLSVDSVVSMDILNKANRLAQNNGFKKSESLTLKQKELKDMVRYGEAEDITTLPEPEAKELYKKGLETVGLSRGTYGLNGALLRDSDGKKYAITARSSNLFYFI